MARPRQGEGLKRTIRQKGDKFYAYEVTSEMVDGKKRTISRYLGRVDPDTGELMEKIPEKSRQAREKIAKEREIAQLSAIEVGDYGGVYLLDSIQRKIGLGKDLLDSFGGMAKTMLVVAETLVQCNGVFDSVQGALQRTWGRQFYGLQGSLDSGSLSHITKEIGLKAEANIEGFFRRRIARNKGLVAWDTTTKGCHSDMEGLAEYVKGNKDNEDLRQVKIGFATDDRGVPLMYRTYPGNVSDMDTVRLLAKEIDSYGGDDPLFVWDRGFESGWNIDYMLRNHHRFVMPANTSSSAVKRLLTEFRTSEEREDLEHDGHMYTVWKAALSVIPSPDDRRKADGDLAYDLVNISEENGIPGPVFTAFVCYDSKKYSDEVQSHNKMISDLKKKAATIDCRDPEAEFKRFAGAAAKHFDLYPDGRKITVKEKQNSLSFVKNRAGLFVMLASPGVEWEVAMSAYDARRLTEQAFNFSKEESPRFYTSDKESMKGREFIRFLDLILRCEISAELREAKMDHRISVSSAVSMADCIQARRVGETAMLTEADRAARNLFGLFGVPVPKEVVTDSQVCSVEELLSV